MSPCGVHHIHDGSHESHFLQSCLRVHSVGHSAATESITHGGAHTRVSAFGGIREILRAAESVAVVDEVLLIDGVHTSYMHDKPGPLESEIDAGKIYPFLAFAKLAAASKQRLLITHSEIFRVPLPLLPRLSTGCGTRSASEA